MGKNSGSITNSYSVGAVVGNGNVGGLCGYQNGFYGETTNSYWDVEASGIGSEGDDNFGAIGKITAQMQTLSTFADAGWDFVDEIINGTEDIWKIRDSKDYPRLWWEISNTAPIADAGAVIQTVPGRNSQRCCDNWAKNIRFSHADTEHRIY